METICKHNYPSDLCGTCNPITKQPPDKKPGGEQQFATIRRYKYPCEYRGWSIEGKSPMWTSDRLSAAPVPLEILMDELNKIARYEMNVWAVVFPTISDSDI